jgi:hypothetical protein
MVYPRTEADMIAEACDRVSRNLSADEWSRFLPGQPYRATCDNRPLPTESGRAGN